MNGIINILKPVGMTSADVVRWVRKKLGNIKAGHIGTLDPGAGGVLPVCIGKATRLAEYYNSQTKKYRAEITFGIVTDTQDAFGKELRKKVPSVTRGDFVRTLNKFIGTVEQIPPMYSSVRKNGKHLYEYARKGIEVAREKRKIQIFSLSLVDWYEGEFPRALFDIECSKGTYIRTLCFDLGEALGCGAYMSFLLRLRSGVFELESSLTLEEIQDFIGKKDFSFIHDLNYGLDLPVVQLPVSRVKAFRNGLPTNRDKVIGEISKENIPVQVLSGEEFLGIGIWKNNCLYPNKVL